MQQRFLGHCGSLLCSRGLGLPRPREENNSELAAWLLICFLSSLSQSFHFHDVKKGTLILLYPIRISIFIPKEHTYTITSKVQIHPGGPSFQGNKAAYKDQRKRKDLAMEFYIRPNLTQKVALPTSLHFLTEEWGEEWADTLKSARERGCVWYKLGTQLQLKDTEVTADINDTGVPAETCVLRWRQPWPPLPKHPCAAFRTLIRQLSWKLSNSVWGQKWTSAKGDQYKPECHMVKRNLSWCDEHSWLSMMSSGIN